uniref:Uncharacterized protein n=1 Tax=Erpetoichthys calabaricus TaxID=27687 RepID=A0A8C4XDJ8_ERPCA
CPHSLLFCMGLFAEHRQAGSAQAGRVSILLQTACPWWVPQ